MTRYQLKRDHPQTARVRPVGAADLRPLAWLRITYVQNVHEIARVDVYSRAAEVPNRLWRGSASTVIEAVAFCHQHAHKLRGLDGTEPLPVDLHRAPLHPWGFASVVDVG